MNNQVTRNTITLHDYVTFSAEISELSLYILCSRVRANFPLYNAAACAISPNCDIYSLFTLMKSISRYRIARILY